MTIHAQFSSILRQLHALPEKEWQEECWWTMKILANEMNVKLEWEKSKNDR